MRKNVLRISVCFIAIVFTLSVIPAYAQVADKININTADLQTLAKLKNIGPVRAESVVKYREENGPFGRIEDIVKVKGIGKKTFEAIKDDITVESPE
jgi:competence protein ComEA